MKQAGCYKRGEPGFIRALTWLLESRHDYLPTVQGAKLASKPGPAPGQRVPCSHAKPVTRNGRLELVCTCHEDGFRGRVSTLDGDTTQDDRGIVFDEYTYAHDVNEYPHRARLFGVSSIRTMTTQELDSELSRLRADERARQGITDNREAYGWELARKRRDSQSDHPALERALERLRGARPGLHGLLTGYYCEGRYAELSPGAHFALGRALIALARLMPSEIRVPQQLVEAANGKARQAEVVSIFRKTNSISAAARESGLRRAKVRWILRGEAGIRGTRTVLDSDLEGAQEL